MPMLYPSAYDFICKRVFDVAVPAYYHPHMPKELSNPEPAKKAKIIPGRMTPTRRLNPLPFRQVVDPSQIQRASYPIEVMLDMFQRRIEFEIINDFDIVEIFEGLDRYLLTIKPNIVAGEEHYITFGKLVMAWRAEVYKHYYRYMQLNPAALQELYPNNSTTGNLHSLMAMASGIRNDAVKLDPLRAKADPPYEIASLIPVDPTSSSGKEMELERTFGVGSDAQFEGDHQPFKLDDFLKRG